MKVVKQDLFCPACGVKDVWTDEEDPGDYYAGTAYYCLTCHAALPDLGAVNGVSVRDTDCPDELGSYVAVRDGADHSVGTAEFREVTAEFRARQLKAVAERNERNERRPWETSTVRAARRDSWSSTVKIVDGEL